MKAVRNKPQLIAEDMGKKIRAGEWQEGTLLPSERKLAETYQVSYMTMRQAVNLLVDRKILVKKHGVGICPVAKPKFRIGILMGFPSETEMLSPLVRILLDELRKSVSASNIEPRTYVFFGQQKIEDEFQYPFLIDDIRNGRIDTLIVEPVIYKKELADLHQNQIPVTILSATDLPLNTVYLDLEKFGVEALRDFHSRSIRKIAVVDSFLNYAGSGRSLLSNMENAILHAADSTAMHGDLIRFLKDNRSTPEIFRTIFDGQFEGVIFNNDYMAKSFLEYLAASPSEPRIRRIASLTNRGIPVLTSGFSQIARYEIDPADIAQALIRLAIDSVDGKKGVIRRFKVSGLYQP